MGISALYLAKLWKHIVYRQNNSLEITDYFMIACYRMCGRRVSVCIRQAMCSEFFEM